MLEMRKNIAETILALVSRYANSSILKRDMNKKTFDLINLVLSGLLLILVIISLFTHSDEVKTFTMFAIVFYILFQGGSLWLKKK